MALTNAVFTTQSDIELWDEYVTQHPRGTFMQLSAWAKTKKNYGWNYSILAVIDDGSVVGGTILLRRTGAMGLSIDYAAYGPLWNQGRSDVLDRLLELLEEHSSASVVLRVEPNIEQGEVGEEVIGHIKQRGFTQYSKPLQPESTIWLDTSAAEEELLVNMRQTTRRYIRKAERSGIEVLVDKKGDKLDEFYTMLHTVNQRKQFGIHEKEYFATIWREFSASKAGGEVIQPYILLVMSGEVCVGAYFVIRVGHKSWELYGGVTDEGMKQKANYLLKWRTIQLMKAEGVSVYDQWGVAPLEAPSSAQGQGVRGKGQDSNSHPLSGVTYFKEGFGGRRVEYVGPWDMAHNSPVYKIARLLKKL